MLRKTIIFVCAFFIIFSAQSVLAYNLLGGKQKTTNLKVVKKATFKSTHGSVLTDAIFDWIDSSNPLKFTVYSSGDGHIYVGGGNNGNNDTLATTYNYREYIFWGDYKDSVIELNYDLYDSLSSFNKKGTMSHEIGHALGLAHDNSNPNVVMCQLKFNRVVNAAQSDDLDGISYLYN